MRHRQGRLWTCHLLLRGALPGIPLLYPAADFHEIYENKITCKAPSSLPAITDGRWLQASLVVRGGQARWVSCNPYPWESPFCSSIPSQASSTNCRTRPVRLRKHCPAASLLHGLSPAPPHAPSDNAAHQQLTWVCPMTSSIARKTSTSPCPDTQCFNKQCSCTTQHLKTQIRSQKILEATNRDMNPYTR